MKLAKIIKRPIITEAATKAMSLNRYSFLVDQQANKKEIARAVEKFFGVHVQNVRTTKSPRGGKKALVQLVEGEKIDLFKSGE